MIGPDEVDALCHEMIERHRGEDDCFDGEVSLAVAITLMASTNPEDPHASPQRMLLRLREWYGPRFERTSVLMRIAHFKDPGSKELRSLARALWENHRVSCPGAVECSLHSLGSLWAYRWLDPPCEDAGWLVDALQVLVAEHPLRGWATSLVHRSAEWVKHGAMSVEDAERLLASAIDGGLHERLANTASLASSWTDLTDAAPSHVRPRLIRTGNRIIAAGGTCLVEPQLRLMRIGS